MSEREKMILEKVSEAIHAMSDFEKGYFLGVAETRLTDKKEQSTKIFEDEPVMM